MRGGSELCDFFFSSRRRHTRLQGDWSSDVCSSDLPTYWSIHQAMYSLQTPRTIEFRRSHRRVLSAPLPDAGPADSAAITVLALRHSLIARWALPWTRGEVCTLPI